MIWKPKYKIWWNDKEAIKVQRKIGTPIIILSMIFFYLTVYDKVSLGEYGLLVISIYIFVYSILDYVFKLPNGFIDDNSSEVANKKNRLYLFVFGIILSYILAIPILAKHYSFFENFIGAQFLIEHFKF